MLLQYSSTRFPTVPSLQCHGKYLVMTNERTPDACLIFLACNNDDISCCYLCQTKRVNIRTWTTVQTAKGLTVVSVLHANADVYSTYCIPFQSVCPNSRRNIQVRTSTVLYGVFGMVENPAYRVDAWYFKHVSLVKKQLSFGCIRME